MATEKEQPAKQPADEEQTKPKRRSSGTGRVTKSQPRQQSEEQQSGDAEQDTLSPAAQTELSQLLQQQISQAIQPVLAEVRSQVARAVSEETPEGPSQMASSAGGEEGAKGAPALPEQRDGAAPESSTEEAAPEEGSQPQPSGESAQDEAGEPDEQRESPGKIGSAVQSIQERVPSGGIGSAVQTVQETKPLRALQGAGGKVSGTLSPVVRAAEQQAETWLQSLLVSALTALLAEATHRAAQQQAERGLHYLIETSFQALPDTPSNKELQQQAEKTLQAILRDALDAVFAEETRTQVQGHGEDAVKETLHGNVGTALDRLQEILRTLVQAFVDVLRRQWQRVLRLLFKIVLTAIESSLGDGDEEKPSEKKGQKAGSSK